MSFNFRLPRTAFTSEKGQEKQIISYLYQLTEQLNWALNTLYSENSDSVRKVSQKLEKLQSDFSAVSDTVVMQGKSGIWTYVKWASGRAECRGTYTSVLSAPKSWGGLRSAVINSSRIDYPFAFTERPNETVTCRCEYSEVFAYTNGSGMGMNTASQTAIYSAAIGENFSLNDSCYLDIYVSGKWK